MATDGNPGQISATSLVQGSQATTSVTVQSGKRQTFAANRQDGDCSGIGRARLPPNSLPPVLRTRRHWSTQLNKYLNDSGRPDEFRVDPASGKLIQQVNPANGAVLGEFSVDEFPALARSVGASGLLIDSLA